MYTAQQLTPNSQAIIIAKTVTRRHLKGPDRWPVGDRAPPRRLTHTVTLHNATLFDLYFAHSHPPYSSWRWRRRQWQGELRGWPAPYVIPTLASVSCPVNRGMRIVQVWSMSVHIVQPKIHILRPQQYAILSLQWGHIWMLLSTQ